MHKAIITMANAYLLSLALAGLLFSSPAHFTICNAHDHDHKSEAENSQASKSGAEKSHAGHFISTFTYVEGEGIKTWGQIHPNWTVCDNGKLQSPIDLKNHRVTVRKSLGKLNRNYKPAPAILKNRGHDIMVEWTEDAGGIKINGSLYKLIQCHWHSPSEHTINGKRYNLELHMVHQNDREQIAAVAILYKFGRQDTFLRKLLNKIKEVEEHETEELGIVNPYEIKFGSRKYYRYIGSLTAPPCTEGVVWTILKKVRTVSREQVQALTGAVSDGYEKNARPTQEHNDRPSYTYG